MLDDEDILVPCIPNRIMTIIKSEYPYIEELLEYKRDGTLLFLKSQGAIAFYDGTLGLDVQSDVKDWAQFKEFARKYSRLVVQNGLQKYQNDEKNEKDDKKNYQRLDMGILGPAIEIIAESINDQYYKKFPNWPSSGSQEDYIDVYAKNSTESNDLRIYWLCSGIIYVKDTRYDPPKNGNKYRAEFSGKPEFQLAYFDLEKFRICNKMGKMCMPLLKKKVDECEDKLLEQKMSKLLISIDI